MSVTGFDHYNLRASRAVMEELLDFYINVVGLRPGYRPPFDTYGHWLYIGSQAILHLSEALPPEVRPAHVANTFDHLALACTDLSGARARLHAHNVPCTSGRVPVTGQEQLFFSDPAGNGVELILVGNEASPTAGAR